MGGVGIRKLLIIAVIMIAHLLRIGAQGVGIGQTTILREQPNEWILDTSFGIPFHLAFNSALTIGQYSNRVIFLLVEDRYCSPDLLSTILIGLAARYRQPESLRIEVFSDPEMLRRAIARYKTYPDDMVFPDTPEGMELEKRIRGDLYIPKTGWARARYCREIRGTERFFYKSDPQKLELVEVVLKPRPVLQYSGNPQEDLFLACTVGDLAKVAALIKIGVPVESKNQSGETPLIYAVRNNHLEVVIFLLAHDAYVDARNKYGQTALIEAVSDGRIEIVRVLCKHNADVGARYGPGLSPLHLAAYKGDVDIFEALLSKGADPNVQDNNGNTPLFEAIESGNSRIALALLQNGASVHLKNRRGKTPLMAAEERGDDTIVKILKSHKMN